MDQPYKGEQASTQPKQLHKIWRVLALAVLLTLAAVVTLQPYLTGSSFQLSKPRIGKLIVYSCISPPCGGWGDRQKGIVAGYILACMLNRTFKIQVTVPCALERSLAPNLVDWRVSSLAELKGSSDWRMSGLDQQAVDQARQLAQSATLDKDLPSDITYLKWNMEVVQYLRHHPLALARLPWLTNMSVPDIYRTVLTRLFNLSPTNQRQINRLRTSLPNDTRLVCVHARLGKHPGFDDEHMFYTVDQLFKPLTEFLIAYNDTTKYRVLVVSDTDEIVQRTSREFPGLTVRIPGPITHIDRNSQGPVEECEGFQKVVADEYALSTCDVLVQSDSGLSKMAAFLRGTDTQLYVFEGLNVKPTVRKTVFRKGW